MLDTQSAFSQLITLSYREPQFAGNEPVFQKARAFVDHLISEVSAKGVDILDAEMMDRFWHLRIELLKFFRDHDDILHMLEAQILQEVSNNYFKKGKHKALALLLSDSLEIFYEIIQSLSKLLGSINNDLNDFDFDTILDLNQSEESGPPELIKWRDSSIALEMYVIIADLIIHDQLELNKTQVELLKSNVRISTEDYGLNASLIGLWTPADDDERKLVRNIKIRLAAHRALNQQLPHNFSDTDSLKKIILS